MLEVERLEQEAAEEPWTARLVAEERGQVI